MSKKNRIKLSYKTNPKKIRKLKRKEFKKIIDNDHNGHFIEYLKYQRKKVNNRNKSNINGKLMTTMIALGLKI